MHLSMHLHPSSRKTDERNMNSKPAWTTGVTSGSLIVCINMSDPYFILLLQSLALNVSDFLHSDDNQTGRKQMRRF